MQLSENLLFAGRYRLISRIGMGGFSEVWKVADEMAEDRHMALKVYAPERGLDEHGIKQFRREYAITLDLNHPNLLKAYHFDVFNGSPYLLMPLCTGGSLYSKLAEKGPLTEKQLAELLLQLAAALEYLHRKDVTHQDIKPDNVLIDDDGNYLLVDFGISSRLRVTMQKSTTTAKSMTVAYAPPEKFLSMAKLGPEGDVFSLGVMMVELLTGDLPWNGMGGAYLRPDSLPMALPESISQGLTALIQRCTAYDPAQRPAPKELREAAERFLSSGNWAPPMLLNMGRKTEVIANLQPTSTIETILPEQPSQSDRNPKLGNKTGAINDKRKKIILGVGTIALMLVLAITFTIWPQGVQNEEATIVTEDSSGLAISQIDIMTMVPLDTAPMLTENPKPTKRDTLTIEPELPKLIKRDTVVIEPETPKLTKRDTVAKTDNTDWKDLENYKDVSTALYGKKKKKTKEAIIKPKYDDADRFYEGLAGVKLNNKWGYIDNTGKEVIPFKYERAGYFFEGLASVKFSSQWGFIDKTGSEVIPFKYEGAGEFREGLAVVKLYGKFGFIDKTGREVITIKYDNADWKFSGGLAKVELNGKTFYINKQGKCVKGDCP